MRTALPHLVIALVAFGVNDAIAQEPRRMSLAPANASLDEEFSNVSWVRELRDGRVIVTDGRDGRVVAADLRTGTVEQISRRGQGPNEYPRALPVWSVGGDSSAMVDSPRRWLMFAGTRVVATLAPDAPAVAAMRGIARGADEVGHVYSADFIPGGGRPIGDSTALIRIARATARVDTLTRLRALVPRRTSAPDKSGFFSFSLPTIAAADDPSPPDSITDWPSTLPPYRSPVVLLAAPDGRLLVPRMPTADRPETRYDVVSRRGTLDGQLVLTSNERIVGFGGSSVYVAVSDDDGIQRIRRHAWR